MIPELARTAPEGGAVPSYVPVSRYAIRPGLARHLPEAYARAHKVVPLERSGDLLTVATADPWDAELLSSLRKLTACEVRAVLSSETEIEAALDRAYGVSDPAALWPIVSRVLLESGLLTPHQLSVIERDGLAPSLLRAESFPLGGILPEADYVEALGLALYLPHLRLDLWKVYPVVAELIPQKLAEEWLLLALLPVGRELVVASPAVPPQSVLDEIGTLSGLEPRLALCTPSEVRRALERAYGAARQGTVDGERPLWRELTSRGLVDEEDVAGARTIAMHTGERVEDVLLRLGLVSERQLLEARARLLRTELVRLDRVSVERPLLSAIPQPIARRHRCLPLRRLSNKVVVAMANPERKDSLELIQLLLGQPVEPVLISDGELEEAFTRLYGATGTGAEPSWLRLGEYLVRGGRVTAEQVAEGLKRQRETRARLGRCLLELGYLDEDGLTEALALQLGIPWVSPRRYAPSRDALDAIPEEIARQHSLLPLYLEGHLITVAAMEPQDTKGLQMAAQHSGLTVRVVAAGEAQTRAAIDRLYGVDLSAISAELREFGDALVMAGLLTREQLLQTWRHQLQAGVPFDAAAVALGFVSKTATHRPSLQIRADGGHRWTGQATASSPVG